MFIPTTKEEAGSLGWDAFDVILISGDAYIDTPFSGVAVIGHVLMDQGYRVGIIAQPDVNNDCDIKRLGEPLLFWGISSGAVDSMISNYTASGKKRKNDDLTPGGINDRRPDRALIRYANLIRKNYKNTVPIVLGGIEASLRRIAHYDYWSNSVRRSVLFDAKADILVYGMGEHAVLEIAERLKAGTVLHDVRGICYISGSGHDDFVELPSYEEVSNNKEAFTRMFKRFYSVCSTVPGHGSGGNPPQKKVKQQGLVQRHGDRYLVHNLPARLMTPDELDRMHELPFERDLHPFYKNDGAVRALDTVRFSIISHRGCFGGCSFCAISIHQGSRITSRSERSIIREAASFLDHSDFKGIISDIGGPTANMYGMGCVKERPECSVRGCLSPDVCPGLDVRHKRQIEMLKKVRGVPGIRKAFIASGVRHDLVMADSDYGESYMMEVCAHHVSGQLKVAPEHSSARLLRLMNKPTIKTLRAFVRLFRDTNRKLEKKQYLTYYFIAAHPGSTLHDMAELKRFIDKELRINPEQVQLFTPAPSTLSAVMYYTETDPATGKKLFVEKNMKKRGQQKRVPLARPGKRR